MAAPGDPSTNADSVWAPDAALALADGDRELLQELMAVALDNVPSQLAALREAVQAADTPRTAIAAHTLKGGRRTPRGARSGRGPVGRRRHAWPSGAGNGASHNETDRILDAPDRLPVAVGRARSDRRLQYTSLLSRQAARSSVRPDLWFSLVSLSRGGIAILFGPRLAHRPELWVRICS